MVLKNAFLFANRSKCKTSTKTHGFIPFGGAGRGPGTGPRFESRIFHGKTSPEVKTNRKFNFLGNSTLKTSSQMFRGKGHRK